MRLRASLASAKVAVPALLCLTTGGFAHSQHVHGMIELGIVLEESVLAVSLRAPLSDVVGFEHAARNEEQADRLRKAAALLADADRMFGAPASARCVVRDVTVDGPPHLLGGGRDEAHHDEHHDHDEHDDGGHHDEHHDHDEHDDQQGEHAHADTHSEVDAQYTWECAALSNVDELEARFANEFENVEKVAIQIITSSGARVLDADGQLDTISIAGP